MRKWLRLYLLCVHVVALYAVYQAGKGYFAKTVTYTGEAQDVEVGYVLRFIAPLVNMMKKDSFPENPQIRSLTIYPDHAHESPIVAICVDDGTITYLYRLQDLVLVSKMDSPLVFITKPEPVTLAHR